LFSIDANTYHKSFEMTVQNDDGVIYATAHQALRYSNGRGLTIISEEDQIFNMSFIVTKNCPGQWIIDTISFNTSGSKQVELYDKQQVVQQYKWVGKQ